MSGSGHCGKGELWPPLTDIRAVASQAAARGEAAEVAAMRRYLRAKIDWAGGGEKGPPRNFDREG